MKSQRNKTIDFKIEDAGEYLTKVVSAKDYAGGINATVNGDFFDLIKKVKDNSIDLLIADPPYNLDRAYHGTGFKKMTAKDYRDYTESWVKAVMPKLKKTASIYVCCDWKSSLIIGGVLEEFFRLKNRITWQREKGRGAKNNWKNGMEDIYFATLGDEYYFDLDKVKIRKKVNAPYRENGAPKDWEETKDGKYRDTCPSNFWDDISVPYWSMAENTAHPTQKPEKLIAKLMLASSKEGDLVLDPFAGSGTTQTVAKKLGRNYIGFERNPLYCAWAERRIELAETDKTIQGYEDGVFRERNSRPHKINKVEKR